MSATFQISPSSGVPIYRQVINQVRRMVIGGNLKPGEELPSVRQVAVQLDVNPMTISKAYSLLEAEGVLLRRRGKGMVVAENERTTHSGEQRIAMLRPVLKNAATQARQLEIDSQTTLNLFRKILEEIDHE